MGKRGFAVITAGPELAKAMPKMFKQGASYIVANASVLGVRPATNTTKAAKPTRAKPGPKPKAKTAKPTKSTTVTKAAKAPKAGRKSSPDNVVNFVKKNPGVNMTQIEVGTKLPQAEIRKALNAARAAGTIRTEGQRRGLRYFVGGSAPSAPAPAPAASTTATATAEPSSEPPPAAGKKGDKSHPW